MNANGCESIVAVVEEGVREYIGCVPPEGVLVCGENCFISCSTPASLLSTSSAMLDLACCCCCGAAGAAGEAAIGATELHASARLLIIAGCLPGVRLLPTGDLTLPIAPGVVVAEGGDGVLLVVIGHRSCKPPISSLMVRGGGGESLVEKAFDLPGLTAAD